MATPAKTKTVDKPVKAKPVAAGKPKATTPVAKTVEAAKKGAVAGSSGATRRALAPDQRRYYVEVAAYYIAERRGFRGDSQLDDWVAAEAEIDRLLREGVLNP